MGFRCGVYAITHTSSGQTYVGHSVNVDQRWREHRSHLRRGKHHAPKLQNAWRAHGEAAFAFEMLEIVDRDQAKLIEAEQRWMDKLQAHGRRGFNTTPAAGSPVGFKHGPEMRRKMSQVHKGRAHTDEHRERQSVALKGRRPSDATIAGSAAYWKGRPHSADHRAKTSAALKGRAQSPDHLAKTRRAAVAKRALTPVRKIFALSLSDLGHPAAEIGELFGCSQPTVSKALTELR